MKNKIAFGLCAAGLGIASIGMMGLSSEGQAGFVMAVKITAVGLDVTMKVRFKRAYLDWIQTHCRPELKRAAEYLGKAFEWYFMGN